MIAFCNIRITRNDAAEKETHNLSRSHNNEREEKCYFCGRPNHRANRCRHCFKTCNACYCRGHVEAVCKSKQPTTSPRPGRSKGSATRYLQDNELREVDKCTNAYKSTTPYS
ncbi:hypothetical protein PUN28_012875 [Cardiocondyla obscurior]|uniref:CCHC-type domain-containing protein n=1 Tax=Cardiocondyla obscurior TaxID=286306 RepID=A0AAW2F9S0_9HYME